MLRQQFYSITSDLYRQSSECMSSPTQFGKAQICNRSYQTYAWVHCTPIIQQRCEVEAARDRELRDCLARAADNREDTQKAEQLKRANDKYDQATKLQRFLDSPEAYLQNALNPFPNALDQLFENKRDRFDPDLGQELYRYTQNQAKAGVKLTPNPIVRRIQSEALKHLNQHHLNLLDQIEDLSAAISSFDVHFREESRAARALPSNQGSGARNSGSPDCIYNRQRFEDYLSWCGANDGCAMKAQMEAIVEDSCR